MDQKIAMNGPFKMLQLVQLKLFFSKLELLPFHEIILITKLKTHFHHQLRGQILFKIIWQTPASLIVYFRSFQTNIFTIFTPSICKNVHPVYSAGI